MTTNTMPTWLKALLVLLAVVVLGPPTLVLLVSALAVAVSLSGLLLKVAVPVLLVFAVVSLLRAAFGQRQVSPPRPPAPRASLEAIEARLEEDERARRAAMDRELELALRRS